MPEFDATVLLTLHADDMGEVEDRLDDITNAMPLDVECHGFSVAHPSNSQSGSYDQGWGMTHGM